LVKGPRGPFVVGCVLFVFVCVSRNHFVSRLRLRAGAGAGAELACCTWSGDGGSGETRPRPGGAEAGPCFWGSGFRHFNRIPDLQRGFRHRSVVLKCCFWWGCKAAAFRKLTCSRCHGRCGCFHAPGPTRRRPRPRNSRLPLGTVFGLLWSLSIQGLHQGSIFRGGAIVLGTSLGKCRFFGLAKRCRLKDGGIPCEVRGPPAGSVTCFGRDL